MACPDEGSTAELSLRLAVQEIRSLRATEPGVDALNENKIESLQILFYKGGTLYWSVSPAPAADGNYIIPIPEAQQGGFDGSSTYDIYVVTNMNLTAPQQESDLAKIVVTESVADKPNAKFVMQGQTSKQINLGTPEGKQLGEVALRRVASKLRITPTVAVEGYALDGTIQIKFVGATDRGCLIAEEAATGVSAIDYGYRDTQDQQPQLFYSYYSNWSSDPDQAPYYLLSVPLKKEGETTVVYNYYRVALTPGSLTLQPISSTTSRWAFVSSALRLPKSLCQSLAVSLSSPGPSAMISMIYPQLTIWRCQRERHISTM